MNDCEDLKLNRLVKVALESQSPLAFRRPQPMRRWLKWSAPALFAASLAVFVLPQVTLLSGSNSVADAIGLLADIEGIDLNEVESRSPIELLLAWQDVPCGNCTD